MPLPEIPVYLSACPSELPFGVSEIADAIAEAEADRVLRFTQRTGPVVSGDFLADASARIRESDLVVAVTGVSRGKLIPGLILGNPVVPAPPKGSGVHLWQDLLPRGMQQLSATEWEIVLAIFWKRPLCLWEIREAGTDADQVQKAFLASLPSSCPRTVIGSLRELRFLAKQVLHARQHYRKRILSRQGAAFLCAAGAVAAACIAYSKFPVRWPAAAPETWLGQPMPLAYYPAGPVGTPVKAVDHGELAPLCAVLDKNLIYLACRSPDMKPAQAAAALVFVSERAEITEVNLRAMLADASVSESPVVRARGLLLRGNVLPALAEMPSEEPPAGAALADYLQVMAQVHEIFSQKEASKFRRRRADLLNRTAQPEAWADAQILALLHEKPPADTSQGDALMREILEIRLKELGPDHKDTIEVRDAIAMRLMAAGDFQRAIAELRIVEAACGQIFGPRHRHTLGARSNLAIALSTAGLHSEAVDMQRSLLSVRQSFLGVKHPDTIASHNGLGSSLVRAGKAAEAEAEFRIVLDHSLQNGEPPAERAKNMTNLAMCLAAQAKWKEALSFAENAKSGFSAALGSSSPLTVRAGELVRDLKDAAATGKPPVGLRMSAAR